MQTKFKKLVDDICRQEGFSKSELSVLIDKSRNYIGRVYRGELSEKSVEKTIELLNGLGIKIKPTELDLVKAENEMLRKQDSYRVQVLDKRNDLLENAKFENEQLENTVKHLQAVLNERTSELEKASVDIHALNTQVDRLGCELEKANQYHAELLNEQSKLKHLLSDSVKSVNNYVVESSRLQTTSSNMLSEIAELNESVKYWSDGYAKQSKINAFMGWCILALLIVIGVVWFK